MNPQIVVLDKLTRRADLALRLIDNVRDAPVNDGLLVEAWAITTLAPRFVAARSPLSGIYGFHTLPGLRGYEMGERPAVDFCPHADDEEENGENDDTDNANFVVTVEDQMGRFLPQLLLLCLPKTSVVTVPLFSSPARPTPSGLGVIRGEVWDRAANAPASWARISATFGADEPWMTVADARGMFALFVPYAAALPALTGNPPVTTATIGEIQWNVTLRAFYEPAILRRVPGSPLPDTRTVMEQSQGTIYSAIGVDPEPAPNPRLDKPLRFGVELIAATQNSPRLLINPAFN